MTTLMKYKPTNGMVSLFDDFFNDSFWNLELPKVITPDYDIIEKDDSYVVDFALAGFNKEDVSLKVENGVLTIEGERKHKEEKYSRKGSFFGKFKKSFTLPDDVLSDSIDASYENGILSLEIPKNEKTKLSKVIEIK